MSDFLRELGYDPFYYWGFFGIASALWFFSAVYSFWPEGKILSRVNSPAFFGLLLFIAMFAGRWPAIFFYRPVNPDEAQFLAGAITTLARNDIWWTDPMTSGPLVLLPLTLPGLIGLPVDFTHARLIGLALSWGVVFFGYLSLRHIHGDRLARFLILPLGSFVICLMFWDFVPYCSEWSPLFLCAMAVWFCFTAFSSDGKKLIERWRLSVAGLVLGIMPFSKFQVLPLTAAIGLSTIVWILLQPETTRRERAGAVTLLGGSAAFSCALMLFNLWHSGNWADEYQSYIIHNLYYTHARGLPWSDSGYILHYLTDFSWGFSSFHYGLLALLGLGQWGLSRCAWRPTLLGGSLLAVAYCAVIVPGRLYPHYLLFLSFPLALLVALQFGYLFAGQSRRTCTIFGILFLILGTGVQIADRVGDSHSLHKLVATTQRREVIVHFINQWKRPGDTLAVWGWRPTLYVETQLPQATREALTEAQWSDNPQRDYFRHRFLTDLQENQPAFFIDTIGLGDYQLTDRKLQGHEVVPELAAYIQKEYRAVDEMDSFRVYVRRDRFAEIK